MKQTAGVGLLKPNTIVFGFPRAYQDPTEAGFLEEFDESVDFNVHRDEDTLTAQEYLACINRALLLEKNVLIARKYVNMSLPKNYT